MKLAEDKQSKNCLYIHFSYISLDDYNWEFPEDFSRVEGAD